MLNKLLVLVCALFLGFTSYVTAFAESNKAYVEVEEGCIDKVDKESFWFSSPNKMELEPGYHKLKVTFIRYNNGQKRYEANISRDFEASKKYILRMRNGGYKVQVVDMATNSTSNNPKPLNTESKTTEGCSKEMLIKLVRAGLSDEEIAKVCP